MPMVEVSNGGTSLESLAIAELVGQKTMGTYTVTVENDTDYLLVWYSSASTARNITINSGANVLNSFSDADAIFFMAIHTVSTSLSYKVNGGTLQCIALIK